MNGSQYPPRAPQGPTPGGRDWDALQARAARRLEARAAGEQRQAGEPPVQRMPSLTTQQPGDVTPITGRARSRGTWFRTTLDAVLRRTGRTRRR